MAGKLSDEKMRVNVVVTKSAWKGLRVRGVELGASASSLVTLLVEAYLDESSGVKKAVERWKAKQR